jgi:hypothetical protein
VARKNRRGGRAHAIRLITKFAHISTARPQPLLYSKKARRPLPAVPYPLPQPADPSRPTLPSLPPTSRAKTGGKARAARHEKGRKKTSEGKKGSARTCRVHCAPSPAPFPAPSPARLPRRESLPLASLPPGHLPRLVNHDG